jgi:hypothetical protein
MNQLHLISDETVIQAHRNCHISIPGGCDVTSNMDKDGSVQGEANEQNTAANLKQTTTRECDLSRIHCLVGAFIFSIKTAIFIGVLLIIKFDNPRETPPSFAPTIDRVEFLLPSLIGETFPLALPSPPPCNERR